MPHQRVNYRCRRSLLILTRPIEAPRAISTHGSAAQVEAGQKLTKHLAEGLIQSSHFCRLPSNSFSGASPPEPTRKHKFAAARKDFIVKLAAVAHCGQSLRRSPEIYISIRIMDEYRHSERAHATIPRNRTFAAPSLSFSTWWLKRPCEVLATPRILNPLFLLGFWHLCLAPFALFLFDRLFPLLRIVSLGSATAAVRNQNGDVR